MASESEMLAVLEAQRAWFASDELPVAAP